MQALLGVFHARVGKKSPLAAIARSPLFDRQVLAVVGGLVGSRRPDDPRSFMQAEPRRMRCWIGRTTEPYPRVVTDCAIAASRALPCSGNHGFEGEPAPGCSAVRDVIGSETWLESLTPAARRQPEARTLSDETTAWRRFIGLWEEKMRAALAAAKAPC
jgi:hypothetical protein